MKDQDRDISIQAAETAKCLTEQRLRKAGLSRSYYMQKLKDLCEATKPISCIKGKEADGGTVDFVDVPDNQVQLGAVKEIIMLYGDRKPIKTDNKITGDVIVNITKFSNGDAPIKRGKSKSA